MELVKEEDEQIVSATPVLLEQQTVRRGTDLASGQELVQVGPARVAFTEGTYRRAGRVRSTGITRIVRKRRQSLKSAILQKLRNQRKIKRAELRNIERDIRSLSGPKKKRRSYRFSDKIIGNV
jgi:hypothetical protein